MPERKKSSSIVRTRKRPTAIVRVPRKRGKFTPIVRVTRAPLLAPTPLVGEVIELEDSFADASLEMDETGEQFRLASTLQTTIAAAAEDAEDALALAATANGAAGAAQSTADAAQDAADDAQTTANTALAAATSASSSPPYVALVRSPSSPLAWNDEFEDGSDDVVARGWTMQMAGTGVVPTRVGPFDLNGAALAANTYRSSILGGKLCMQCDNPVFISKPLSASCALAARVNVFGQAAGQAWGVGVSSTPQHTAGTASFFFGWNRADQAFLLSFFNGAYSGQGTVAAINQYQGFNIQWFDFTVAAAVLTAARVHHISEISGMTASLSSSYAGSFGGFTALHGGLYLIPGAGTWFEIDYIRQYAAGKFFPS